ncbi:MAG: hypothetical protein J6X61_03250 [Clostridia bacterium]|nr:hypothetical protein [Clostridia bacterium]
MNEAMLNVVIGQLKPVIDSQKFVRQESEDCVFVNATCAFRIRYDEQKHIFLLEKSDLKEDGASEFYTISSYLFDDRSTEADAKSVGNDFLDTLNNELGLARSVAMAKRDVPLPGKSKGDGTPGLEAFCNRFLTLFPAYKDQYKEEVARYGGFMPDHFFSRTAAVVLRQAVENRDMKQLDKMAGMLDQYYVDGDYEVQSTITYSIVGEAFRDRAELFDAFLEMIGENCPYLRQPAINMMNFVIKKGK